MERCAGGGSRLAQASDPLATFGKDTAAAIRRYAAGAGDEVTPGPRSLVDDAASTPKNLTAAEAGGFPLRDEDGAPLIGIGHNEDGSAFPQYGQPDGLVTDPKTGQQVIQITDTGSANDNPNTAAGNDVPAGQPTSAPARGAAGARRGIEAVPNLPQQVATDVQTLTRQGVPDDQAMNEAAVKYVGGKPTLGSTTRDFETMQTEQELAKEAGTPEGRDLRTRHAENNAALHDTAQQTVQDYGGIPAQGEAAETVATSLAKASDAEYAKVRDAYATARAQDGDKRVSVDSLRELLDRPNFRAPTTTEGKQLVLGLRAQIDEMARANRGRFTPDEIEQLWQEANRAYSPMGKGATAMIEDVKKALTESLDQFDAAGPAFKAARAAHRQWAEQYADPAGVARLIERNAKGDFVHADDWRRVENGLVGTTSDKGFVQVVRRLKANGDTASLNRLKADIVQRAYEAATKGTADHFGNPRFTAKAWEEALNRIGLPKLQAIFSPEELGHLSVIGHAARALNEPVLGAVNGSGTSSALVNAARRVKDGAPVSPAARNVARALRGAGHLGATVLMPGKGNLMVEGVSSVAGKMGKAQAEHSAGKALGQAIRKTLDPAKARQMDDEEVMRTIQRLELAKALSKQAGAASAVATSDSRK